ncbi:hypothetical protein SNE35_26655 [Paucibacter sp. R3-3]|uniref:Uncharacterized protein n=1 Tax=Roseateles agri TaxID=3098619 RepID=A0ABU5DR41_9BURK|nr:hypothetical protein [Paucibacter sp. R3-3]MDY0748110.1 hypothetical protein [Paucibacter sp. R3-3]
MRNEFEMSLPSAGGVGRSALASIGQRAFEQALGGPDRVLLLALDLLTEGCDHVDVFEGDYRSNAERRWGKSAIKAHEAVLLAASTHLPSDRAFRNEYLERAFLTVTPYAPVQYERKDTWIDAYLTRLHELHLEASELLTPKHGQSAYGQEGMFHPVWCADQLFVQVQACNEWPRRPHPVGRHESLTQLRVELEAAIAAADPPAEADGAARPAVTEGPGAKEPSA